MSGEEGGDLVVRHLEVVRSARYALLMPEGDPPSYLWFVLHGFRQLAPRFLTRFRPHLRPDRGFVAPEALNRFYLGSEPGRHGADSRVGATWMTREDRETEIRDYVRYLDRLHDHVLEGMDPAPRVGVLGFSQGVHTAARWVTLGGVAPEWTVLWGAYLPGDLDEPRARAAFGRTRLTLVNGRADEHRHERLEREHEERLARIAPEAESLWHAGGHELDDPMLERVLGLG